MGYGYDCTVYGEGREDLRRFSEARQEEVQGDQEDIEEVGSCVCAQV